VGNTQLTQDQIHGGSCEIQRILSQPVVHLRTIKYTSNTREHQLQVQCEKCLAFSISVLSIEVKNIHLQIKNIKKHVFYTFIKTLKNIKLQMFPIATIYFRHFYLRKGGYVFAGFCLFVCLFVCLSVC